MSGLFHRFEYYGTLAHSATSDEWNKRRVELLCIGSHMDIVVCSFGIIVASSAALICMLKDHRAIFCIPKLTLSPSVLYTLYCTQFTVPL